MNSDSISATEWRWVATISGVLVAFTLLPYAWALAISDADFSFMGILTSPFDGAANLSKIEQGAEGAWLSELRYTPEVHDGAAFHMFYTMLGNISNFLGLSNTLIFHLARVITSFFMFTALYQLGATVWVRIRPRRLFFLFASVGSGLGWFVLLFDPTALAPDLRINEAFPLLAAYTNPHYPLTIGFIALISSYYLVVFRPGFKEAPTIDNGGLLLLVLTILITIVSTPGALVIGGMLSIYTLVRGYRTRHLPMHEVRWTAMFILPATPFALYYLTVFDFNEVFRAFNSQSQTESPNLILFVMGYGLLLFVAIPGIWRAFRRFEPDGDQLMLCWLIANVIAVYLPLDLQRRLFIGLIIPIVYFAVRALEDYWVNRIPKPWQTPSLIALFVFILPTHTFTFGAAVALVTFVPENAADSFLMLDTDYIDAFDYLESNSAPNDVLLAASSPSLWLPTRTSMRVVYGHPFETVPVELRLNQVQAFYRGENCVQLFQDDVPFTVDYALWGPQEIKAGRITPDDVREGQISLSDLELDDFNLNQADDYDLERALEERRLDTADRCLEFLEANAVSQRTFGDVTVYSFTPSATGGPR